MIITNINLTLPGHGYAMFNNHPLYVTRKQYEPSDMLYLTYFDNFVNGYDTPIVCTDPEYKWNASTYWTSNSITSVDGTLPETYIGQKYLEAIGNRQAATLLSIPGIEEGVTSFNLSFWSRCTNYASGAGGLFGIRYHTAFSNALFSILDNGDSVNYGIIIKSKDSHTIEYYNGGKRTGDNNEDTTVSSRQWHH